MTGVQTCALPIFDVVSFIVNFGVFVDLGGVDGLVHVSELSWKHIDHPSEVVEVGQEVTRNG